jgi:hypothetical protein
MGAGRPGDTPNTCIPDLCIPVNIPNPYIPANIHIGYLWNKILYNEDCTAPTWPLIGIYLHLKKIITDSLQNMRDTDSIEARNATRSGRIPSIKKATAAATKSLIPKKRIN